jgi:nucleotide-binding universal stress UspA family protein
MYQHVLVPIDCTDGSRHLAQSLIRFMAFPCRITLAATITPTPDRELQAKRQRHANDALRSVQQLLLEGGIWTRSCLVEGSDTAMALATEAKNTAERYDMIVLGTHQTRTEDFEAPCKGSFSDQLCARTHLPVLVLPEFLAP